VFVGTMDARLVALNKDTGEVVWDVPVIDWQQGYSITGAPLAVKDMVLTGVAGGEFGIRGFVKAYDAKTGKERWTRYVIPGPGEPGNDTWPGDTWQNGGGSTWTTGAFDPELNLVYWNVGNAGPWNCQVRKGDNKWTAGTVALDPDTGEIKWGFQYTPWDCWDYDSVSTPVLADVTIDGREVKTLLHHDKNGFFYVLDRTDGKFIYGEPIVPGLNWAKGLDPETGRPLVNEAFIAQSGGPEVGPIIPSLEGAIDWQPLAFDPTSQHVFFMSNNWAMNYKFWEEDKFEKPTQGEWYLGADYQQHLRPDMPNGAFVAWDVANRKPLWRVESDQPFWAGALVTQGGLVFTGDNHGYALALDAKSGKILWHFPTGSPISGSPVSYELDGTQYVLFPSGMGGDLTFYYTEPKVGNLIAFALERPAPPSELAAPANVRVLTGSLPQIGEPGHTLGGRVMEGYGYPPAEAKEPVKKE
jgi:alcohol dehydrogenase (cytochrome c)